MNLRKDNKHRKEMLKSWIATPPAIIKSPLKRLHAAFRDKLIGRSFYQEALNAADKGNGLHVKQMARYLCV